jgi:C1A family cysteine protease
MQYTVRQRTTQSCCCGAAIVMVSLCVIGVMFFSMMQVSMSTFDMSTASSAEIPDIKAEFLSFVKKFHRFYTTSEEKEMRFRIFADNYMKISNYNMEGHPVTLGVNGFTDLTDEEYFEYLNLEDDTSVCKEKHKSKGRTNVIDWEAVGKVARVKDQGGCGSCYAFSAVGAMETLHANQEGKLIEFSEQELVDCSYEYGNQGCSGGWMDSCYNYVIDHGIAGEDDYVYAGYEGSCKADKHQRVFHINGCRDIVENDNDSMLDALQDGSLGIAIDASSWIFRFYREGIITGQCFTSALNHGVLLVAAGVEEIFDYWLIKNSWGSNWGAHGYVKVLRETGVKQAVCGVSMASSYPF